MGAHKYKTAEVDGQPLSPEEATLKRKKVDFSKFVFPEVNPLELSLPDYKNKGSTVKLVNYRWPAVGERRGVVHWVHGYGDYVGRHGWIAQAFAQHGYDFVGIDQRGFGNSEGRRGMFESEKIMKDDLITYA